MVNFILYYIYYFFNITGDIMKKIKYVIFILLVFIGINSVNAITKFDNTLKVYDYAQLLTEKEEKNLKLNIDSYINRYNVDMVIVTVKYYEQINLEDYMNLFYAKNNFGKGNTKDGIIIVVDLKENSKDIHIKVYGNTEKLYSENELEKIYNNINKEDKYYDKLLNFIEYSNKYIYENNDDYNVIRIDDSKINWLLILIPSLVIPLIIILFILLKNKKVVDYKFDNYYLKDNSLVITKKEDKFNTTSTKKNRIKK